MSFLQHFIRLQLTALLRHIVLCCVNPVTLPSLSRQLPLGNCNQALLSTQLRLSAARKSQQLSWRLPRGDRGPSRHPPSPGVPWLLSRLAAGSRAFLEGGKLWLLMQACLAGVQGPQ